MKSSKQDILKLAKQTLQIESDSIKELIPLLNEQFVKAVQIILKSAGRVVVTGIGKSAIIANKFVATLNSTGTPALFLHAADAIHGDLGMVRDGDVIICISKSGESPEIKVLIPLLQQTQNKIISVTGNMKSFLAGQSDLVLNTTVSKEACPNNLAPTSSTTAQLAMCDALAVCLLNQRGFTASDFAKVHPGGLLGKKLYLKVDDLSSQHAKPLVNENDAIKKVILTMTSCRLGATAVQNQKGKITGIITDGDLRRMMNNKSTESLLAKNIMGKNPKSIDGGELAVNALEVLRRNNISQLVVMKKNEYAGMLHIHDLLKEGLI